MTDARSKSDLELFETNPALFLERVIKEYTAISPKNAFSAFSGNPIFDEPLVGFADGDDSIFQEYKVLVGDFHLTPREALEMGLRGKGTGSIKRPSKVSVISWALPITHVTRLSMRREFLIPSLRWNHTRWQGAEFSIALSDYLVCLLEEMGYQAISPNNEKFFIEVDDIASNWSQRHIAYAAGLGTFSLNDGFISPKGIAVRLGSVVSDISLPPSRRTYSDHLANCAFYHDKSCRRCIERCPANAISEQGHDKRKCHEFVKRGQAVILKQLGREEGYIGHYLACGTCQTKVPCEDRIPPVNSAKSRKK